MKNRKRRLLLSQVSRSLTSFNGARQVQTPSEGWVKTIRTTINMTLLQLAKRMNITSPTLKNFEKREMSGSITLKSLREIAEAMDMIFVYAIIPREGSLEDYVDKRAEEKAKEIVNRTNTTMSLEDQQNPKERLMAAFQEKKNELKNDMPKFLWDQN